MSTRARAIHEADAECDALVGFARASDCGRLVYDEILLRAMRRRKDAAARIDAEWSLSGEDLS